ncbi:MAG: hypothetical protein ACWGSQ_13250, partial [Longimicrobiales bacterium]
MTPEVPSLRDLPDAVQQTLHDLEKSFGLLFRISQDSGGGEIRSVYTSPGLPAEIGEAPAGAGGIARRLNPREGPDLDLLIYGVPADQQDSLPDLVTGFLGRAFEFAQEVRFFTYELSERYEEINLLYSISET